LCALRVQPQQQLLRARLDNTPGCGFVVYDVDHINQRTGAYCCCWLGGAAAGPFMLLLLLLSSPAAHVCQHCLSHVSDMTPGREALATAPCCVGAAGALHNAAQHIMTQHTT
jgi:hypothetical protein